MRGRSQSGNAAHVPAFADRNIALGPVRGTCIQGTAHAEDFDCGLVNCSTDRVAVAFSLLGSPAAVVQFEDVAAAGRETEAGDVLVASVGVQCTNVPCARWYVDLDALSHAHP